MTTIRYRARPHQLAALQSKKPITFLGAGVGAGKTDCGTLWLLQQVRQTPPGTIGLLGANTYPQLFDATLRNVLKNLDRFGWPHAPRDLPRSHSPLNLEIWSGTHMVTVLCRSMDAYENLSGVEIGWAWLDEVWQTKEEAFNLIQARCRDKAVTNRILLTTTLDDPTSWMYRQFVDAYDEERMRVIYASTYDNAKNLPDGYAENLKASYSERLFERMVLAKWVSLETGQIYYAFERSLHEDDSVEFDPARPVCWSLDFNIGQGKPMSSVVLQLVKGVDPEGNSRPEIHVIDEIVLETADTNEAAEEFTGRWRDRSHNGIKVYGDATGKARDTRSKKTDYAILEEAGYDEQYVGSSNPPIRERHNAVNSMLKAANGDIRIKIHPRCKTLLRGLETVKLKKGASYIEDDSQYEQHVTAALGYFVAQEFPVTPRVTIETGPSYSTF